jgi:GTP cyclohydrolase II
LYEKLKAYNLQDQGLDTVDANLELGHLADERSYDIAALILNSLKVKSVALITNNPQKIDGLTALGICVSERIAIQPHTNTDNIDYLKTKAERMHHMLSVEDNH